MSQMPAADGTREPQYNRCLDIKQRQGLTSLGLMTNQVWEDDPETGVLTAAARPNPAARPLGYKFPLPSPAPSSDTHSAAFRYWVAAEALRRGADFWAPRIASGKWQPGADLAVLLDEGEDLNAYYDRQALKPRRFLSIYKQGGVHARPIPSQKDKATPPEKTE